MPPCKWRSLCFFDDQAMVIITMDTGTYRAQLMSASFVVCHVCGTQAGERDYSCLSL